MPSHSDDDKGSLLNSGMWIAGTREGEWHPPDSSLSKPLIRLNVKPCVFKKRLNRFVGLIEIEGREDKAHITNTGRLNDLLVTGAQCLVSSIIGRKLKYRIIGVKLSQGYALIDTLTQMKAYEVSLSRSLIPFFNGCSIKSRSPRIGDSVFDYRLDCHNNIMIVEVKSAVLRGPRGEAMYPDCPSTRGRRHVRKLISLFNSGMKVALIMIAAFPGARCFMPFREGDPVLYELIHEAYKNSIPIISPGYYMKENGEIYLYSPDIGLCPWWLYNE